MTKLEELKAAAEDAYGAADAAWDAYRVAENDSCDADEAYREELKKTQKENPND